MGRKNEDQKDDQKKLGLGAKLRQVGLKSTKARIAVLGILETASSPLSHAEIADLLLSHGLDKATVYRNLISLTEVGLALRSDHGDHVWRFELARKRLNSDLTTTLHPHFVCTDCGTVCCMPSASISLDHFGDLIGPSSPFQVNEVQFKGRCKVCYAV